MLSGGGARGAYEVGVLRYVWGELARRIGRAPRVDLISGTSVGAINGAFLASVMHEPIEGVQRLVELWASLELDRVLGFGPTQAARLPRVLLGGRRGSGVFDVAPLVALVTTQLRWADIRRNLTRGSLSALTVSATRVATGRPWCFVDHGPQVALPPSLPPLSLHADRIGPPHVLASAAIPVLFPPVPVRGDLYVDGGLRLNTPMAPALHLGARRVLVVGLTGAPGAPAVPALEPGVFPGVAFLVGKMLNAFLLDHVNADFAELDRINRMLDDGVALYGPDFVDRMNERAALDGRPPRHRVHAVAVHPSADIGRIATAHMRRHRARFGRALGRTLFRLLDLGEGADADLSSYLLFDGSFARELMDLGEADARRHEAELARFFVGHSGQAVDSSM